MYPKRTLYALILILLVALALRTTGLRGLVYANPDEALWSYFIVTTAQLSPVATDMAHNALARIMSWDYGYPLFVLDYVYVRALELLGAPVSEWTLPGPLIAFGTLNCLLVFLVTRRLGGTLAALIAAALMAVMPLTVGRSRSIGGAEAFSGFVFLLAILQVMRYLERPEDRRRQWLAGLCVGLYLCGDVQFLVGGAVLVGLMLMWPGSRLEAAPEASAGGCRAVCDGPRRAATPPTEGSSAGWRASLPARLRLIWKPGILLPPLILFLPYIPAWLYAIKLGYPDQTYLGTVLAEHKADWGLHLGPFMQDLARNMGVFPVFALVLLLPYFLKTRGMAQKWLLLWIGLTALPFLVAVTSTVTEAAGYHEHLVAGLAVALGLSVAAFGRGWFAGEHTGRPVGLVIVAAIVVVGPLLVTLGGVFRVGPLVPLWPSEKIPYGGLVANSGMKTAGYWVRQRVPLQAEVFVAHDPAVAYWYCGRECITGGLVANADRKQALLKHAKTVRVAVIPGQEDLYPPEFMASLGFRGRISVAARTRERLNIYLRESVREVLETTEMDRRYDLTYRTSRAIIPPPWPYVPGKPVQEEAREHPEPHNGR